MNGRFVSALAGASLLLALPAAAWAQAPAAGAPAAGAPAAGATVTATCKDGTSFSGTSRSGACSGHGGVKAYGDAMATQAPGRAATSASGVMAARPGGGPGQVWVNTASKVYHCSGDRNYGTTKKGEYMTEAAAKAAGNHAAGGKACS